MMHFVSEYHFVYKLISLFLKNNRVYRLKLQEYSLIAQMVKKNKLSSVKRAQNFEKKCSGVKHMLHFVTWNAVNGKALRNKYDLVRERYNVCWRKRLWLTARRTGFIQAIAETVHPDTNVPNAGIA